VDFLTSFQIFAVRHISLIEPEDLNVKCESTNFIAFGPSIYTKTWRQNFILVFTRL